MKKFLVLGVALVAMLAIPAAASADVQRCEASVPTKTVIKTATFTVTHPAQEYNQWDRLWTRSYTVTINPESNTFAGVGEITGDDSLGTFDAQVPHDGPDETITGSFANGKVSLTATRVDGVVYSLTDAPMDSTTITVASLNVSTDEPIKMKVSAPVITETVTTTPGTESVKNHGQFVKAQGGGKTAAQACAGMPLNSTQGGSILK